MSVDVTFQWRRDPVFQALKETIPDVATALDGITCNREMPVNLEEITGALRALHVVDLLARGDGFGNADDLRDPLNAAIVLPEATCGSRRDAA